MTIRSSSPNPTHSALSNQMNPFHNRRLHDLDLDPRLLAELFCRSQSVKNEGNAALARSFVDRLPANRIDHSAC